MLRPDMRPILVFVKLGINFAMRFYGVAYDFLQRLKRIALTAAQKKQDVSHRMGRKYRHDKQT